MPNWACANYVALGDRIELEELVRILNTKYGQFFSRLRLLLSQRKYHRR